MKKIGAVILTAAFAVSMISGCGKQLSSTDPSVTGPAGETTAATEASGASETQAAPEEPKSFEELYGEQFMNYFNHQYFFDGEPISVQETNFYFINAFLDLSTYASYGYYPATTLGYIDLAAEYPDEEFATFGDFFVDYAENSIESACIMCARADEAGIVLTDETQKDIDEMLANIRDDSAAASGKTLDEYLQFYYGPGNDEATFRKVLERYYLADAYSKHYCETFEFADEEMMVPYIRYALFQAAETASQEDKDKALAAATAMKDACKTIDDLTGLAETAFNNGEVLDQGDIMVPKGQMVPKFEEWAYGEGRTEGELDIIYAPEYGYFVVGYLGLKEQEAASLDQIALKALGEDLNSEIDANKHDFHTDTPFQPAPAAPTATPTPETSIDITDGTMTIDPNAVDTSTANGASSGSMSTTDVLVVVFLTLAGVAVVAVVVILVMYAMKNGKNGGDDSSKKSAKYDDYDEDEEESVEDTKKNEKSSKTGEASDEESDSEEDSDEDDSDDESEDEE